MDFDIGFQSLFLRYNIPIARRTKLVIKNGYAKIPKSKGLIPTWFSKPPNVVNKSAGKITGTKLKIRIIRVGKKINQLKKSFRCMVKAFSLRGNISKQYHLSS